MNGCIIDGTPIAVDYWKLRALTHSRLFFLTHLHSDHTKGLTSSWRYPIYTSELNAKLLTKTLKIRKDLVKPLRIGFPTTVSLDGDLGNETMLVTLLDANHCPGSVMFVFRGYFGDILYTGDFRYDPSMIDRLNDCCARFDRLYLDNTYCSPRFDHPTRESMTELIVSIVRDNPERRVVVGMRSLGKEELLVRLAQTLRIKIVVSPHDYEKMRLIGLPDVFTTNRDESRVSVEPFHLCAKFGPNRSSETGNAITILPTSIFSAKFASDDGHCVRINDTYLVRYSDHSSFPELMDFVGRLRPRSVIAIVADKTKGPPGVSDGECTDMSVFDPLLDVVRPRPFVVPDSVRTFAVSASAKVPQSDGNSNNTGLPQSVGTSATDARSRVSQAATASLCLRPDRNCNVQFKGLLYPTTCYQKKGVVYESSDSDVEILD